MKKSKFSKNIFLEQGIIIYIRADQFFRVSVHWEVCGKKFAKFSAHQKISNFHAGSLWFSDFWTLFEDFYQITIKISEIFGFVIIFNGS